MKTAVVFPGFSPSSYPEVQEFIESNGYAEKWYSRAEDILGYSLKEAFREATEADWEINELAFLINTLALADYAGENHSLTPEYCMGSSFGGMIGAVYTGSLSLADALWLSYQSTNREKRYMTERIFNRYQTDFIYQYPAERVMQDVRDYTEKGKYLEISSYLSRNLVAVSGEMDVIREMKKKVRQARGISLFTMDRLIHCKKLKEIKEIVGREVHSKVSFRPPRIPMISDIDGSILVEPVKIKNLLLDWFDQPVRMHLAKTTMKKCGIEKVFVVGPRSIFGSLMSEDFSVEVISPETACQTATG
ncbi:ACP S-malonyltransferase [Kroppenstedtia eburnea]|uniref:[acyl-carrier-protein] S-malonyltransferase n=1 Tax=Kroppenstedtia eburnea TaxID=714067 RepID=A0A1N7PWL2_9BACL|nr:ACP S-malonyltransferase [Kroppenstedtia eburnea]QKI80915.1 ACP S-malonyltransferase [Kroppenstedtia eburnea]SIT14952.1 [acyl-carrier-protein] S-malonyltransferase [Kroppenstedtia eburnea]